MIDGALEHYRLQRFLEDANEAFAALRSDPEAWREEQQEREVWAQTLFRRTWQGYGCYHGA